MRFFKEREMLVQYGRRMSDAGLSTGTSGNLSVFSPGERLMVITPSGMDYHVLTPGDMAVMDLTGRQVEGSRAPSSEWALHAAFYLRYPKARAVIHTHSLYCTTLACLGQPLRPVHYAMAGCGVYEVPCAPYRLFGSRELAEVTVHACGEGRGVLMANHGLCVWEEDLPRAYALAENLEFTAQLQWHCQAVGTPRLLTREEMAQAAERFGSYGQKESS